jgi:hypothetical protein
MAARRLMNLLQRPRTTAELRCSVALRWLPWSGLGDPVPHARQEGQAFSVIRHWRRLVLKKPVPSLL